MNQVSSVHIIYDDILPFDADLELLTREMDIHIQINDQYSNSNVTVCKKRNKTTR
jgi:hypothetical protein